MLHAVLPPDAKFKRDISHWYPSDGERDRGETPEPRREINELNLEYPVTQNFAVADQVLFAISKDLDGAFYDIRSLRKTIEAIASNSDLREDFREYLENQKRR